MSVLNRLASASGRRDEALNIELARALVDSNDLYSLAELQFHLHSRDGAVASDCIKVLYEAAALKPELVAPFTADFLDLLTSKDNRMVWGAMTALSYVAPLCAAEIWRKVEVVLQALRGGSVITVDRGVKVLAHLSSASPEFAGVCFPEILRILDETPPKGLAYRAEASASALPALTLNQKDAFFGLLERRGGELTPSQFSKIKHITSKFTF